MREAPLVDDVGLGIIAHARSARRVSRKSATESRSSGHFDCARRAKPFLRFRRRVICRAIFIFARTGGDADYRVAKGIFHCGSRSRNWSS